MKIANVRKKAERSILVGRPNGAKWHEPIYISINTYGEGIRKWWTQEIELTEDEAKRLIALLQEELAA